MLIRLFCTVLILAWSLLPARPTLATAPPAGLLEDLVQIEKDHFIIDKHVFCQLRLPLTLGGGTPFNSFGLHVRFMAPARGLISRDVFVALSMRLFTEARISLAGQIPGLTTEQAIQVMQCREVAPADQQVVYDFQINMTRKGVEQIVKDLQRGTERRTTEPWETVLRYLPRD